jgi:hypothetical protein
MSEEELGVWLWQVTQGARFCCISGKQRQQIRPLPWQLSLGGASIVGYGDLIIIRGRTDPNPNPNTEGR